MKHLTAATHRRVISVLCVLALVVGAWLLLRPDHEEAAGPYSGMTRAELRAHSRLLLVPGRLPEGMDAGATSSERTGTYRIAGIALREDQLAFELQSVGGSRRDGFITYYTSAVLGEGEETRYEVRQFRRGAANRRLCRVGQADHVVRQVEGSRIVICSSDLKPGSRAWTYWSEVDFTYDLDEVDWLRGD